MMGLFPIDFYRILIGFLKDSLWFSMGFSLDLLRIPYDFLKDSPWISKGFPLGFLKDFPIDF